MSYTHQSPSARTLWALFFMLLVCASTAQGAPADAARPMVAVVVENVQAKNVTPPLEYVGRVEAIQAVDLTARVQGYLDHVGFNEGDMVTRGKQLYLIEQAPYTAQVEACKALVAKAEATLNHARKYLDRLQSTSEASVAQTDMDAAEAGVLEAEASLKQAEANLRIAQIDVDYTTIEAPITGRIGKNNFTRGNLVGPASGSLARIVQTDPIRVVYSVSENDFVTVKLALMDKKRRDQTQSALIPSLRLPNGATYSHTGTLDFVDNEVDPTTGTIAIRAEFPNPDELLLPGTYVTVMNSPKKANMQPVVPQAAVQEDKKGRFVYTVDANNQVQRNDIVTGPFVGTYWAVTSGIQAGERVVVQGVQKIGPGQEVKVVTADTIGRPAE
ncbi:efflux RND transporter periplasmic adaptor subunit [Desulfoplanes sp. PS50]